MDLGSAMYIRSPKRKGNNMDNLQWWGYLHTSGTRHVKRYFGPLDVQEARESPFCAVVVGPFAASSRDEAEKILDMKLRRDNR